MKKVSVFALLLLVLSGLVWGQDRPSIAAKLGYPELIIHNAKIVTMDDPSFESRVGTIAQAMAIRDKKILALGSNTEIRALAGPQTKQIDLKGRTVLPSFIMTHEHPTDWIFMEPEAMKHVIPEDNDFIVVRWLKGTAQEQIASWESVLKEAASKAKPGQWVWLSFFGGPNYENYAELWEAFPTIVTKERLDYLVPSNPVIVKKHWVDGILNSKGMEEVSKVLPAAANPQGEAGRAVAQEVIFRGRTVLLAELLKAEMELWAAHGITTSASGTYGAHNFQALSYLDRRGGMPARFGWAYPGPDWSIDTLRYIAGLLGTGSDYLWNVGARAGCGGQCTTAPARPGVSGQGKEFVEARSRDCSCAPGRPGRKITEDIVRTGGRIATMHSGGDRDIDNLMDAIRKASQEAGMTLDDMRSKRHAFDHSSLAPRPDQIPIIKNLGMMVSMLNTMLWETHQDYDTVNRARDYGMEYTNWAMPRNSTTKGGVMSTFEIDRPLPQKLFLFVYLGMTRTNPKTKQVYGPGERTDRIIQLKALTRWGGYYLLREDRLGTLEPGKLADFIVLDRDYLTIPEDDIPNVKVIMTAVGGKIIHLMPQLAREIGMVSTGPATWPTKPLENYFAR